ncbi:TonB-dependent receptor [Aliiglaciecola sp. LCG003]|uniref:TonB-dependent receptor plug domain-containing protein n=1 Tax=Aliiglaciecola sp. LCG003 TaxID=3053655 RepID=UPI0025731488|nr:TonB-dependent receptor [Aliiglaciecola sp. LCG003]WJG10678.1 TonB-dependent receptor [Aliiglaciecola sp. LCG003]
MKRNNISMVCNIAVISAFSSISLAVYANSIEKVETIEVLGHQQSTKIDLDIQRLTDSSTDYRDSLNRLPGMSVNGNGPVSGIPQYRGLFGDRLAISIDGAPIDGAGPNGMDPPLSHVVSKPASKLTFYRGIAPVSAGVETLGGAVKVETDIQQRFSTKPKIAAQAKMQGTDQGSARHYTGQIGYSSDRLFASFNGLQQQRDQVEDGRGLAVPNSFYNRSGFGSELGVRNGQHMLHGVYQRIDTNESGTPALAMDIKYIDAAWYRLNYTYSGLNVAGSDSQLQLKVYGNSNQHGMNNFEHRPLSSPLKARLNTVDSIARGYEGVWQNTLDIGALTAGLSWHNNQHNSVITNPLVGSLNINNFNQVERTRKSAYLEWVTETELAELTLGSRFTQVDMQAGGVANSMAMMNPNLAALVGRFNQSERDLHFSFADVSAHAQGSFDGAWQWQAAIAQKNRAPSYTELYVWLPLGISAGLADGKNYLGNLELNHETSRQVDLGVSYYSDALTIAPRVFYQAVQDYIVGTPSEDPLANMVSTMMSGAQPLQWQNTDATIWGADILVTAQLSDKIDLGMTASWVRGTRDDIDQPLYRIAPASLMTQLHWRNQQLTVSIESQLFAAQHQVSQLQSETQSAGYGLINLSGEYRFNKHISLSLAAKNLFDKAYQPHLGGVNRVAETDVPVGDRLYETGRELSASLTLVW